MKDHYVDAQNLVNGLQQDATVLVSWAVKVNDAAESGYTSTEILMKLRFHVQTLLEESDALSVKRRLMASELVASISKTLKDN